MPQGKNRRFGRSPVKESYAATVRSGDTAVHLVVDVQNGVVASAYDRERVIANVGGIVRAAREKKTPVIWVRHEDDGLVPGSNAWEIVPELDAAGDVRIGKRFNSAFEDTDLDAALERLGAARIVLAGAATNWCIRATAYGALDRGYDLTLISDAHTTDTIALENGAKIEASSIIEELNVAMRRVRYPGRTSTADRSRDCRF